MTPSVRRTIRERFPSEPEARILAVLGRFGRGHAHARSAIAYDVLLNCAAGSVDALSRLVDEAVADPVAFQEFAARWRQWIDCAAKYEARYDWAAFFGGVLRAAAADVARYWFRQLTSHSTLCMSADEQGPPFPADIYVVPILGGHVLITGEHRVTLGEKSVEAARAAGGELLTAAEAAARITFHVSKLFPPVPGMAVGRS